MFQNFKRLYTQASCTQVSKIREMNLQILRDMDALSIHSDQAESQSLSSFALDVIQTDVEFVERFVRDLGAFERVNTKQMGLIYNNDFKEDGASRDGIKTKDQVRDIILSKSFPGVFNDVLDFDLSATTFGRSVDPRQLQALEGAVTRERQVDFLFQRLLDSTGCSAKLQLAMCKQDTTIRSILDQWRGEMVNRIKQVAGDN